MPMSDGRCVAAWLMLSCTKMNTCSVQKQSAGCIPSVLDAERHASTSWSTGASDAGSQPEWLKMCTTGSQAVCQRHPPAQADEWHMSMDALGKSACQYCW